MTKTILLLARTPRVARMIKTRNKMNDTAINMANRSSTPAFIVLENTGDKANDTNTAVSMDEMKKRLVLYRREQIIATRYSRTIL